MRILFLTSTFHPKIGGAETYALNVTSGLSELGHTIEIVTDDFQDEPSTSEWAPNMTVKRLHRYRESFDAPDRIRWEEMAFGLRPELAEIAGSFGPDVVISNSLDLCLVAKLISLTTHAPWIATFHEQAPERDPMGEATLQLSYRILQPDAVIAGSRFYLERAQRYARPDRCHLIYHGIDTKKFRAFGAAGEIRESYGIPSTAALLVSLGRFKARKGFLDLIRAFAALIQSGRSVALIIAGSLNSASTAYLDEMRSLVDQLDINDHLHIEDTITNDRVPWLLSGSDIVVQASLEEGLGLAVMEAMACGRPVVATRIPGHTEIISDECHAVLVEPAAPDELADTLASLLDDAARRRRLGENARARIARNFSLDAMAVATDRLLRATVEERTLDARP